MIRSSKLTAWTAILYLFFVSTAYAGAMLKDLENALMCKCDDKCGKVLINCTCSTADKTRKSIQKQLDSGLTVQQIVKSYVDKYGETVLSAPTKTGFNLTAWITPFAALVGGGIGIRQIIRTWVRRKNDDNKTEQAAGPSEPEIKLSQQLQKELDNLDT